MAQKKKAAKRARAGGFSAEERAAMRERVREAKAEQSGKGDDESTVLAKIGAMPDPDRTLARRIHAIVRQTAPGLTCRLWYGMPAYARDGKVLCYFQDARKFKTRYATLGFSDKAHLDDGQLWPVVYAVQSLSAAEEARIAALVKQAMG